MDDTFLVITKNELKMFVNVLNKYHNRLKFTHEVENNEESNFLDISVKKRTNGTVKLDLLKKNAFSGRYVNFQSAHSIQVKIGIVKNLSDKISKLSDPIFHNKNFEATKNDLILNNYPANFITKYFEDHKK